MRDEGTIERTVALVKPEAIGLGLTVFISIQAPDHSSAWIDAFSLAMRDRPEVLEVLRMAGDVDYLLKVAVADMAAFDAFYRRLIDEVTIKNVSSHFVMEKVKHSTSYPVAY